MPRFRAQAALATALLLPLAACAPKRSDPFPNAKQALADLPPRFQAADLKNGEELFGQCRACHTAIKGGANLTGPNLHGVFGRKPGAVTGYAYSDAMKAYAAGGAAPWTADLIDRWLADPKDFMPGTRMSFPGYPDGDNRRDVIAYLKVASTAD